MIYLMPELQGRAHPGQGQAMYPRALLTLPWPCLHFPPTPQYYLESGSNIISLKSLWISTLSISVALGIVKSLSLDTN